MALPRLPLPALEDTCEHYLESLRPILGEEDLARSRAAVKEFLQDGGAGKALHRMLEDRKALSDRSSAYPHGSWLEELWDHAAYLDDPQSLLNVNFFGFGDYESREVGRPLLRAARMVVGLARCHLRVRDGSFAPDFGDRAKKQPLCMFQYTRVIGATRVPGDACDELRIWPASRHVAVCCRQRWFEVEAIAPSGAARSVEAVLGQLEAVDRIARAALDAAPPIAALTALPRRKWAAIRARLAAAEASDAAASLARIESSLFTLSLDAERPRSLGEQNAMLQRGSGASRWMDKACQLVVFANGRAGFAGDHSAADAPTPVRMLCEMGQFVQAEEAGDRLAEGAAAPKALGWGGAGAGLAAEAEAARTLMLDAASDEDLCVTRFVEFGKATMKRAGCSPDAWVQMALQVAHARDRGALVPTYETGTSRAFFHGRTETCRALTAEVAQFVTAFEDPRADRRRKVDAFAAAVKSNRAVMGRAVSGKGVDRHLLGLYLMAKQQGGELPGIFADPAFARSCSFLLSTSQMTPPTGTNFPAFPAPLPCGYGVCYSISDGEVHFSVSAKHREPATSAARFARHITAAMLDLAELLLGPGYRPPAARL